MLFCMGEISPPLGINLFITINMAGCKYFETAKVVIPFFNFNRICFICCFYATSYFIFT
ncbi:MAG: TRAP transporter large permease subunit [Actinobacteria bacterium]|nr:TRAP transporter large permease subunit [Actinomycetota bacterium]